MSRLRIGKSPNQLPCRDITNMQELGDLISAWQVERCGAAARRSRAFFSLPLTAPADCGAWVCCRAPDWNCQALPSYIHPSVPPSSSSQTFPLFCFTVSLSSPLSNLRIPHASSYPELPTDSRAPICNPAIRVPRHRGTGIQPSYSNPKRSSAV